MRVASMMPIEGREMLVSLDVGYNAQGTTSERGCRCYAGKAKITKITQ